MKKAKPMWLKTMSMAAFVLSCVSFGAAASQARMAKPGGDILYSARYYLKPGTRVGTSHYHLYRINPDGSSKRQITFGAHDDGLPLWSPNGRQIAFLRDDKALMLADENGQNATKLLDISAPDYWEGLRWSPDGTTIGFIHHAKIKDLYAEVLYLVDVRTRKAERTNDVDLYAWSSDSRKLLLSGSAVGLRVLNWPSHKVLEVMDSPSRFAWISPTQWVGLMPEEKSADGDPEGIKQIGVFDGQGKTLRTLHIAKNKDGDYADWRSYVAPIPANSQAFMFGSDISTSSGHEDIYFRASAIDGHMTRLGEGEFLAWAPEGKRYLMVTYHDTPPYDTLPNGHKRLVYTTKLQIGTSGKNLRDLVSGLVYVQSADWRKAR